MPGTDPAPQVVSLPMQRIPHIRQRVAIIAVGFVLVTAACGGGDLLDPIPDDQPSDSTIASGSGVTAAPATEAPQPEPGGEDRGAELVGRWEVINYVLPDGGGLTNLVGADPVFFEFNADGTLAYNTGCNSGTTEYATSGSYLVPGPFDDDLEGQPITIGPSFAQTEIGCEGFLGDQDRDLPTDMGTATRFRIDDDQLSLHDEFVLVIATRAG